MTHSLPSTICISYFSDWMCLNRQSTECLYASLSSPLPSLPPGGTTQPSLKFPQSILTHSTSNAILVSPFVWFLYVCDQCDYQLQWRGDLRLHRIDRTVRVTREGGKSLCEWHRKGANQNCFNMLQHGAVGNDYLELGWCGLILESSCHVICFSKGLATKMLCSPFCSPICK